MQDMKLHFLQLVLHQNANYLDLDFFLYVFV